MESKNIRNCNRYHCNRLKNHEIKKKEKKNVLLNIVLWNQEL